MRAIIRERRTIHGLESGSGLEHVGDYYFVVGDDSPDLFILDAQCNLIGAVRLFASNVPAGARIPKNDKPDLEAMSLVEWNGRRDLLCFGSGSKSPQRDVCYRVDVTDPASPQNVRSVPLTALYDALRANPAVVSTQKLNLEAAATRRDTFLLFQRGNISGVNTAMAYDLRAFMTFLDAPTSPPPLPRVLTFSLPKMKNRHAGFSAALAIDDSIFFSASVEDTDNEIDDGATLGSFIGRIDGSDLQWTCPVEQNQDIAPVKIEGISVLESRTGYLHLIAVTDNDEGDSEILDIEVL